MVCDLGRPEHLSVVTSPTSAWRPALPLLSEGHEGEELSITLQLMGQLLSEETHLNCTWLCLLLPRMNACKAK